MSTMTIREGAKSVRVENSESTSALVFDEASVPEIEKVGFVETYMYAKGEEREKRLADMAKRGLIVLFDLEEENDIVAEVVVGEPLTAKELAKGRWRPPQRTLLRLPSGRLAIDSFACLRFSADRNEWEKGATVEVPPGDYALTLHHADVAALDETEGGRDSQPWQVLVLTPLAESAPIDVPRAVLPVAEEPPGADAVEGGVWRGQVVFADEERLATNLGLDAVKALGLKFGMGIRLEVAGAAHEAVYVSPLRSLEEYIQFHGDAKLKARRGLFFHSRLGGAWLQEVLGTRTGGPVLWLEPKGKMPKVPKGTPLMSVPTSATLTLLPEPIEPYDVSWAGDWKLAQGQVTGRVLRRVDGEGTGFLVTTFDDKALAALGAKPGSSLVLRIGKDERPLELFGSKSEVFALAISAKPRRHGQKTPLAGAVEPHWYAPEHRVLYVCASDAGSLDVAARDGDSVLLQYRK